MLDPNARIKTFTSTQENSDQITSVKDISLSEDEEFAQPVQVESSFEDENISNLQDNGSKRRLDHNNLNHENNGRVKRQRRSSIILKDHYVLKVMIQTNGLIQ
jgi:hypothetical protein